MGLVGPTPRSVRAEPARLIPGSIAHRHPAVILDGHALLQRRLRPGVRRIRPEDLMARTRFSLATCNLYNLNLPGLKMYRDTDGWDAPAFARKLQWLAEAIRRVDAHVWGQP